MRSEETKGLVISGGDGLHGIYLGPPENNIELAGVFDYAKENEKGYRTSDDREGNFA